MRPTLTLLALILLPLTSSADIVAAWDVAGIDLDLHATPFSIAADTNALALATATISLSTNVNQSTSTNKYGFKITGGEEQTTLAGAITAGHYMEIALVAETGYHMSLSNILMYGESTGTGCDDVALLTSLGGFTSSDALATVTNVAGTSTGGFDTDASGFGGPILFSGGSYENVTDIQIRIYGWNSTSGSGSTRLRNLTGYDLTINGTVEMTPIRPTLLFVR
jgi:hypothetical protein